MMFHDSVSLMQILSAGLIIAGVSLWWCGLRRAGSIAPAPAARAIASRSWQ
jgi:hypothetical protein